MTCPKVTQLRSDSKDTAPLLFGPSGSRPELSSCHRDRDPGSNPRRGAGQTGELLTETVGVTGGGTLSHTTMDVWGWPLPCGGGLTWAL